MCPAQAQLAKKAPDAPALILKEPVKEPERLTPAMTEDYRLGPGDHLAISVPFADEINNKGYIVDTEGFVNIAFAGRIRAAGRTTREIEENVKIRLLPYFESPHVVVNIVEYGSQPVSVIGEVHVPAVHQLHGNVTLVEMLSASGGLTQEAGPKLEITRDGRYGVLPLANARTDPSGKYSRAEVDLTSLLAGGSENIAIRPNDIISVPRARLIYVLGEVHKPGGFPLRENESASVLQVLALAEGTLATAGTANARILRAGAGGARQEIPVNLVKVLNRKQPDILLRPDDVLYVPNSKAKSATLRGIETALQIGTGIVVWGRY